MVVTTVTAAVLGYLAEGLLPEELFAVNEAHDRLCAAPTFGVDDNIQGDAGFD